VRIELLNAREAQKIRKWAKPPKIMPTSNTNKHNHHYCPPFSGVSGTMSTTFKFDKEVGNFYMSLFLKTGAIFVLILLSGCMQSSAVSRSGSLVSEDIREIDIMPMSGGKYQMYIRGNSYSDQSELREQFKREANSLCNSGYELIEIKAGEVEMDDYKKPTLEATVKCL